MASEIGENMEGVKRRGDGWLVVREGKWGEFVTVGKFTQMNKMDIGEIDFLRVLLMY